MVEKWSHNFLVEPARPSWVKYNFSEDQIYLFIHQAFTTYIRHYILHLEKEMATHCSILAGKSHGQRSLVGYSPWGHRIRHNWMTSTFTLQHYHIHTITSSGWRMAFGVAGGNSFHLPQNLFHSTLLYSIYFSSLITICFKNRKFSLQICMQKCNQEGFSSHLCGTQTSMQLT